MLHPHPLNPRLLTLLLFSQTPIAYCLTQLLRNMSQADLVSHGVLRPGAFPPLGLTT